MAKKRTTKTKAVVKSTKAKVSKPAKKEDKVKVEKPIEKPKPKKVGIPAVLQKFEGKIPKKHAQIIQRPGYTIYLINGGDERTINELQNSGKVFGAPRFGTNTIAAEDDEIIFVVNK